MKPNRNPVKTMKLHIITAANERSPVYPWTRGAFIKHRRPLEWLQADSPRRFKAYLEGLGFTVTRCEATPVSTAVAWTAEGIRISFNGYCTLMF